MILVPIFLDIVSSDSSILFGIVVFPDSAKVFSVLLSGVAFPNIATVVSRVIRQILAHVIS